MLDADIEVATAATFLISGHDGFEYCRICCLDWAAICTGSKLREDVSRASDFVSSSRRLAHKQLRSAGRIARAGYLVWAAHGDSRDATCAIAAAEDAIDIARPRQVDKSGANRV